MTTSIGTRPAGAKPCTLKALCKSAIDQFGSFSTVLSLAALASALLPAVTLAQESGAILPKEYSTIDGNFVDFASAKPAFDLTTVRIGTGSLTLEHRIRIWSQDTTLDAYSGGIAPSLSRYGGPQAYCAQAVVAWAGQSEDHFCVAAGIYTQIRQSGSSLVVNADGSYTHTKRDGTVYLYRVEAAAGANPVLKEIRSPNGVVTSIAHISIPSIPVHRISSVTRNNGLQLRYTYESNTALPGARNLASVTAVNLSTDYCDPLAITCTYSRPWPTASFSRTNLANGDRQILVTDQTGGTTRITADYQFNTAIGYKPPSSPSADVITYATCANSFYSRTICTSVRDGATTTYGAKITTTEFTPTFTSVYLRTSPTGALSSITSFDNKYFPRIAPLQFVKTEDGLVYRFDNNSAHNRLLDVTDAAQIVTSYVYDARGNVLSETVTPPGTSLGPISRTADYDTACTHIAKCNQPNWVRDAMQNQTDYQYDTGHGGVLRIEAPADSFGLRSVKRFVYEQRRAWYKSAGGSLTESTAPIWVLKEDRICKNSATVGAGCAASATDEVVTTYDYGPSGSANNLYLRGVSVVADGVTRRTCYTYDALGNKMTETSPRAGLGSCY